MDSFTFFKLSSMVGTLALYVILWVAFRTKKVKREEEDL